LTINFCFLYFFSNKLQEFKKKFWEMKLAEATEKVKVINERLIGSKSKREGEKVPVEEEEAGAGADGGDGGAASSEQDEISGGQENQQNRPAEEPSEEEEVIAVNGHPEEPSDPSPSEPEDAERESDEQKQHGGDKPLVPEEVELQETTDGGADTPLGSARGEDPPAPLVAEEEETNTETGETVQTPQVMLNGEDESKKSVSHEETNGVNGVHDDDNDNNADLSGLGKEKEHFNAVTAKSTKASEAVAHADVIVNGGPEGPEE